MTQVVATNSRYPCCGRIARFHPREAEDPQHPIDRKCPSCGMRYIVTRRVLASHGDERVDEIIWTPITD